jgi:hypothetical protein
LGLQVKCKQANAKEIDSSIITSYTTNNGCKNTPRDTRNPQKLLFYYIREDLPNGTKNHERKWEIMRERWERFWHNRVVVRIDVEMRRGRLSFILGREEKPLLDELQVSHIQER